MSTRRTLCTAALLVALPHVLAGCSTDEGAAVGTTTDADPRAITPLSGEVRLPTGVLELSATTELDSVPATDLIDADGDLVADDDIAYLGLAWTGTTTSTAPVAAGPLLAGADPGTTLAVTFDDTRIDLGRASRTDTAVFVALPAGATEDGVLEVAFDGVVQEVALTDLTVTPGDASALYADPAPEYDDQDCSVRRTDAGVGIDQRCGALLTALPYVPEAGWAPAGTTWAAVRVETGLDTIDTADGAETVTGVETTVSLDGEAPVAAIPSDGSEPGQTRGWFVFPWPPGPAQLTVSTAYAVSSGEQTAERSITLRP